ncbi:MAG: hypothetical protein HYY21_05685 [Candidatus Tectomicrobia bacterium]|nr:hypothetical protein [Candidatus Tectomicrobia bacterium]
MENKTPKQLSHEHLEAAEAALDRGDARRALELARKAYEVCPDEYPTNYNALSVALECMKKLELKEETETIRRTMQKLLWEHETKPHAEGEARGKHPLKKDKAP